MTRKRVCFEDLNKSKKSMKKRKFYFEEPIDTPLDAELSVDSNAVSEEISMESAEPLHTVAAEPSAVDLQLFHETIVESEESPQESTGEHPQETTEENPQEEEPPQEKEPLQKEEPHASHTSIPHTVSQATPHSTPHTSSESRKRNHPLADPSPPKIRKVEKQKGISLQVLKNIRDQCADSSQHFKKEMEECKLRYFCSYFKKGLEKIPLGRNILESVPIDDNDEEGFYKCFCMVKTCVNCEIQIKTNLAFRAVFNLVSNMVGKAVHTKFVVPQMQGLVGPDTLDQAFSIYQANLDHDDINELQCVSYLVQKEMDNQDGGAMDIPHPLYNSTVNQATAISKYLIHLLSAVARDHFKV